MPRSSFSPPLFSTGPEDGIDDALDLMAENQLRRLPVVDADGSLCGILSISDVIRHSDKGKGKKHVSNKDAMKALKAICAPRTERAARAVTDSAPETPLESMPPTETSGAAAV